MESISIDLEVQCVPLPARNWIRQFLSHKAEHGMACLFPVSYTHLDVYKRQSYTHDRAGQITEIRDPEGVCTRYELSLIHISGIGFVDGVKEGYEYTPAGQVNSLADLAETVVAVLHRITVTVYSPADLPGGEMCIRDRPCPVMGIGN